MSKSRRRKSCRATQGSINLDPLLDFSPPNPRIKISNISEAKQIGYKNMDQSTGNSRRRRWNPFQSAHASTSTSLTPYDLSSQPQSEQPERVMGEKGMARVIMQQGHSAFGSDRTTTTTTTQQQHRDVHTPDNDLENMTNRSADGLVNSTDSYRRSSSKRKQSKVTKYRWICFCRSLVAPYNCTRTLIILLL